MSRVITLQFDASNNFDSVDAKYNTIDSPLSIARNAIWVINCAMAGIEKSYGENAPRRIEMQQLHNNLCEQLRKQLTADEIEELKL